VVGAAGAGDAIGVAAGELEAPGDAIGVADAAGDALGVACAITLCPMFPGDAWPDGAATAVSPRLATRSEVRTPVLSRFNIASLDFGMFVETDHGHCVGEQYEYALGLRSS
jgi:hypothetical protein